MCKVFRYVVKCGVPTCYNGAQWIAWFVMTD